jgi:hypothetical protein
MSEEGPSSFYCPIGLDIMVDPVVLVAVSASPARPALLHCRACNDAHARCAPAQSGHTFERANIEAHLAVSNRAPMSGLELEDKTLVPNHALRNAIQEYLEEKEKAASSADAPPAPPPPPPSSPPPTEAGQATTVGHTLKIERGSGGSVGLTFRRPKGSATGPFEIMDVKANGPAKSSGLGVCVCVCTDTHMRTQTRACTRTCARAQTPTCTRMHRERRLLLRGRRRGHLRADDERGGYNLRRKTWSAAGADSVPCVLQPHCECSPRVGGTHQGRRGAQR